MSDKVVMEGFVKPLRIDGGDDLDIDNCVLFEWQDAPGVKQVITMENADGIIPKHLRIDGAKPNRVISTKHEVIIMYDAGVDGLVRGDSDFENAEICGFEPLAGREGTWIASVSAPSAEIGEYHWFLQRLGAFIDRDNVHLVFGRVARPEESVILDKTFPGWKEGIEALTDAENERKANERAIEAERVEKEIKRMEEEERQRLLEEAKDADAGV